jgi:hypothetical protein
MNVFLEQFSRELPGEVHGVMVLDQAGWHTTKTLKVPPNVTLVHLPPKSPQLNPAENLWHYLRSHYWSNRLYKTWDDLKIAAVEAWRKDFPALLDIHDRFIAHATEKKPGCGGAHSWQNGPSLWRFAVVADDDERIADDL